MIKYRKEKVIDSFDWDALVKETYKKPYCFQQQEGCKERGTHNFTVPDEETYDDDMHDSIPEVINGSKMGVKFHVWLARDPNEPLNPSKKELKDCNYYWGKSEEHEKEWKESKNHINMFYERNFYPDFQTVANDLHKKGLIEAGDYVIDIDW